MPAVALTRANRGQVLWLSVEFEGLPPESRAFRSNPSGSASTPGGGEVPVPPAATAMRLARLALFATAALTLTACQGAGGIRLGPDEQYPVADGSQDSSLGPSAGDVPGALPVASGIGTEPSGVPVAPDSDHATDRPGRAVTTGSSPEGGSMQRQATTDAPMVSSTSPGGVHAVEPLRNNPTAADLLDHWGHRAFANAAAALVSGTAAPDAGAAALKVLQAAVRDADESATLPDLQDGDDMQILGSRNGLIFGRWTSGPADTLSISFDLSGAGPLMADDPVFRAMLERSGKAWSNRIADTWSTWHLREGDFKGWLINGTGPDTPVYAGAGGEVSTGLVIDVRYDDLPSYAAGWAQAGTRPPGQSWEPRFAPLEIDREHLQTWLHAPVGGVLFATLTHEIGHVLGAWQGGETTESYAPYTDAEAGTWTGPSVVALHGGPAPFQDDSDPKAWVDGKRDPFALEFDFAHSGVCASLMAYCRDAEAVPAFLPHAIDFAFLEDLGMTVLEETARPETYGLAGWAEHSAFTFSVSRDLRIVLAESQPHYRITAAPWYALEVTDLLSAGAYAFGYRSTGSLAKHYPQKGSSGTVSYAGGLIGAAIDVDWKPPVIGDAALTVDLGTLEGTASFTSLAVYSDGTPETFAGGGLYYPFALSDEAIVGTDTDTTLLANFYGPAYREVAGTIRDPRAGLLASFGATHDDRPDREEVVASADYLEGRFYRSDAPDPDANGWFHFRCEIGAACSARGDDAGYWGNWTATTRDHVLAATARWDGRSTARLIADRDFVRIERQAAASTDGARGRHVVDGYVGTMTHSGFGIGFESYNAEWTGSEGTHPFRYELWRGFQGAASGRSPGDRAHWSGLMLGYQHGSPHGESPFVEGRAAIDYYLSTNSVEVRFGGIAGRDGQRNLPDIGFEDLSLQTDGTFAGSGDTGTLTGGFFGPGLEEAAGAFRHYGAGIHGSFGARAIPDTVTLEEAGSVEVLGTITDESGTRPVYGYDAWGFWGRQFDGELFGAYVEQEIERDGQSTRYWPPTTQVYGTPSGSNPGSGGAVWTGRMAAFDETAGDNLPVTGTARLELDLTWATIDVEFTDLDSGSDDLAWRDLAVTGGSFRNLPGDPAIEGAFYGTRHQGVAGTFDRDQLQGVFSAVRN